MIETRPTPLSLAELALIFGRTGALAFGGGGATLAMLHDEFCVRRQILASEEFQALFGLARLVPGINILALTVLLGHQTCGFAGALVSLVGLTVPSFTIIVLGCKFLVAYQALPPMRGALRGLGVGAAVLLFHTGWQLAQGAVQKLRPRSRVFWLLLAGVGAVLVLTTRIHPAWLMAGGGALWVLISRRLGDAP